MDDDFELSEIAITRMALFSYISSNASLGSNQHLISDIGSLSVQYSFNLPSSTMDVTILLIDLNSASMRKIKVI